MQVHALAVEAFVLLHAFFIVGQALFDELGHLVPHGSQGVLAAVLDGDLDFFEIHPRGFDLFLDDLERHDADSVGQNGEGLLGFLPEDLAEGVFDFFVEVVADGGQQGDRFRPHGLERCARRVHHVTGVHGPGDVDQVLGPAGLFVEVMGFVDRHEDLAEVAFVRFHEVQELLEVIVVNDVVLFTRHRRLATQAVPEVRDTLLEEHLDGLDPDVVHRVLRHDVDLGVRP
ncbi:hypothetical protein D3C73_990170 [compost metagenome]